MLVRINCIKIIFVSGSRLQRDKLSGAWGRLAGEAGGFPDLWKKSHNTTRSSSAKDSCRYNHSISSEEPL